MAIKKEIKKINVNGQNIAYLREGQGSTVLLIHGITTYSFIWQEITQVLCRKYDVIAIDLLGCGRSDKPLDIDYSLKNHSLILKEFIEILGIKKLHLVGHDVGGGIAQIMAVNYPELFWDVTIINSVAYNFWPVQPIIAMRTPIVRQLAMASLDLGALKIIVKRGMFHKEKLTMDIMESFSEPFKTKQGRKAFLHFAKSLNNRNLIEIDEDLKKLNLPFLIIRGDADVYLSAEISDKLKSTIANSKLTTISSGGHFIQLDEPELLSMEMMSFFSENI